MKLQEEAVGNAEGRRTQKGSGLLECGMSRVMG